jgi:hypothetical protein
MAVVFGVTFFSQYTPRTTEEQTANPNETTAGGEPPLRFGSISRKWDPTAQGSLQDDAFPGFYEVNDQLHNASFWFENRNPRPVTMTLGYISCSSCSEGRVAPIPPEITRQILQMSVASLLPQGLFNGLALGNAGTAANLAPDRLQWQAHSFLDNPNARYQVPGEANQDGWSPLWGILELRFKVSPGPKILTAGFVTEVQDMPQKEKVTFQVAFEGVNSFEVSTPQINVGEFQENSEAKPFEFLVFSSTRGPGRTGPGEAGDLSPPSVSIRYAGGVVDPRPFIKVEAPTRVPAAELYKLSQELSNKLKKFVRVESAYQYRGTITPRVGDDRLDVGLLERDIWLALPGSSERQIRIKGMVRGPVWLDNQRPDIELPSYNRSQGLELAIKVDTEQPDAVLEVVGGESTPAFAKYTLDKLPADPDRGYYNLRISIARDCPAGSWSGVVVLQLKGAKPQKIRIPIRGFAFSR